MKPQAWAHLVGVYECGGVEVQLVEDDSPKLSQCDKIFWGSHTSRQPQVISRFQPKARDISRHLPALMDVGAKRLTSQCDFSGDAHAIHQLF